MSVLLGPVILDLNGVELENEEREILNHPQVGGVILFARNYLNPEQLTDLCNDIRAVRKKPLFIMVDQEGGSVQRFKNAGFTPIPSMGLIGRLYEQYPERGLQLAEDCGWLIASELLATGVDFSLTPILDINKGLNSVIGDRAFGSQPEIVIALAKKLIAGLTKAGMKAVGKHFPGHGSVNLDSHYALPIDERPLTLIEKEDLLPFAELIKAGLDGIMPAHIIFSAVDSRPASASPYWLKNILREKLNFKGLIFSDDLSMKASDFFGDYIDRAEATLQAGCDYILICNNRSGVIQILDNLNKNYFIPVEKVQSFQGKCSTLWQTLQASHERKRIHNDIQNLLSLQEESL